MTDSFSLTKTVVFNAPPEQVWDFLIDKDKLGLWYHPARADLEKGRDYALFKKADLKEGEPLIWGRVIEMDPPRRLVTTFCIKLFEGRETTVTWRLDPVMGGTRLTLTHEGVDAAVAESPLAMLRSLDRGWDEHFAVLREAVAK